MKWGGYLSVFGLSTFKFMFSPGLGPTLKMNFLETYLSACSGGIVGAAIFYFAAEFFIKRSHNKRVAKRNYALENNIPFKEKKKFTRLNRFIIRIKMRIGMIGICFWAPFFMSIPVGSIVVAKFYGKRKLTFPLICIGMGINGLITTGITYTFYKP